MDCLGKREQGKATICFGFLFCKPIITCRAQWAPCLAHTWKQNSGLGSGHGTIDTSPDTAFPIEMQTSVDMAPVSAPVFRNAFLGSTRSFFFSPSAVNAVLTVSYIIWWHQRKHSSGCRLGRSCHLWQICDKLHFSTLFILSDEGPTLGKTTWPSLDGNGAMSHWTAIASALRGGDLWSLSNPSL